MDFDLWEPVWDAASKAVGAVAVVGTAVFHARRAIAQLDPATAQLRELRKAFPRVVEAGAVQLQYAHGPLRESLGRTFPVDQLRGELAAPGLTTSDKVALWDRVIRARLSSLVAGCVATAGLASIALVEITTQLVKKAKADEAQSAAGSFVSNAILAQMQRSGVYGVAVSGGAFSVPGPHLAQLISRVDDVCTACAAALEGELPANFNCRSPVTAADLSQWLSGAVHAAASTLAWDDLVALPAEADLPLDPIAASALRSLLPSPGSAASSDGDWVGCVARDPAFRTVLTAHASALLGDCVLCTLPDMVQRCPSFNADGTAAMVQVAPGLAHSFSDLLRADTLVPPTTVRFCEAMFATNSQPGQPR